MNEDLDKKLKQAQEEHQRMLTNFEIAKKKNEQMNIELKQLQLKYQELEIASEEQKKKLAENEMKYTELENIVKANQQQQNKAALAEAAADNVIQGCLQNLLTDETSEQNWEGPSSSSTEQTEEYNRLTEAIQQNRNLLVDLLKRVETIQQKSKNN